MEQDGKKYAVIEIIDESISRPVKSPPKTRVRISPAGKARALATLLEKPLHGPPELGHDATVIVGRPVDFTSNHATQVLYEIPNPIAWEHIQSGEWGPVSPRMTPTKAHYEDDVFVLDEWVWDDIAFVPAGAFPNAGVKTTCIDDPRLCGFTAQKPCGFSRAVAAALDSQSRLEAGRPRTETDVGSSPQETGTQEAREKIGGHPGGVIVKNTENEAANITVLAADAWNTADAPDKFFAIVPDAAKGPDGKKSLRKLPLASIQKKDLDEAIIKDALSRLPQTDFAGTGSSMTAAKSEICSAARSLKLDLPSCEGVSGGLQMEVDACMTCEHEKVIAELTDKNTKLDAELNELKAKPPAPPTDAMVAVQAELKSVKAECEALKAWKVSAEEADHMHRVQAVVDLRIKNGVLDMKDVQAAVEALKKLPNEALDTMKADHEAVKSKFDSLPSGPKARLLPPVAGQRFDPMKTTVGDLVGKPIGAVKQ